MEMYMTATEEHPFYKRCVAWNKKEHEVFELGREYAQSIGVDQNDFALSEDKFYVNDTEKYRVIFKGKYMVCDGFLCLKKNSKVGKGWKLERPYKPNIAFEIDSIHGHYATKQFITQGKLYVSVKTECTFKKPDGFTEIKASEFYSMIEKMNEKNLKFIAV